MSGTVYDFLVHDKEDGAPFWYGRGIYSPPKWPQGAHRMKKPKASPAFIDFVPDRNGCTSPIEDKSFWTWVDKKAIPALKKWATDNWIETSSEKIFEIISDCGRFVFRATPNRSYGYMYMGATNARVAKLADAQD